MAKKRNAPTPARALDPGSGVPLHLQVRDILRHEALNAKLVEESGKFPTEFELVKRFGVSRITVRNALQSLVEEGLLVRERGRGTFLNTNRAENLIGRLAGFTETIKEAGFQPGAAILHQGMTNKLDARVKSAMQLQALWELRRLRYADDKPIAIEQAFLPPEIGLELEHQDLTSIAMYKFLEDELHIPLVEAKQTISAVNANAGESELLKVGKRDALLYIERVTFTEEHKPVEFLKAIYRPDYFQYTVQLSRRNNAVGVFNELQ